MDNPKTSSSRPWLATYAELGIDWDAVPVVPEKSLSDYVAEHARARPEREALVYLGEAICYRELDSLADRFANALASLGCARGDVLGIHLPNTPQYVVAFLAASKLGMVVSSISALLTPPEAIHQATDARVKVLLSFDALFPTVGAKVAASVSSITHVVISGATDLLRDPPRASARDDSGLRVPVLGFTALLADASDSPRSSPHTNDDVILLQYTGGTTGKSKGAELTQHNVFVNALQADLFNGYRIGEEVIASAYPMFHIGGGAITFNAMRVGATFMVVPDPRNVVHFTAEMQARPPTVLVGVPALFQMLLACDAFRALDFTRLRLAVTAAAPFSADEKARLESVIGVGKISELYGMTETGPVQTLNPAGRFKLGYVGVPLPGTEVRIVDVDGDGDAKDVPLNEPGEIIVRGPQVMRGYRSAEGSSEALRTFDGETYMFTGDVGAMDDEGYVRLCDRSKDMLIVGGFKLFSVEVESKLQALAFVALSAVVGRPDATRPGNDVARLYVQKKPGTTEADDVLRDAILGFCRANLAPYKVPREIVFVDSVPLTSVGKIDKKALRALG